MAKRDGGGRGGRTSRDNGDDDEALAYLLQALRARCERADERHGTDFGDRFRDMIIAFIARHPPDTDELRSERDGDRGRSTPDGHPG